MEQIVRSGWLHAHRRRIVLEVRHHHARSPGAQDGGMGACNIDHDLLFAALSWRGSWRRVGDAGMRLLGAGWEGSAATVKAEVCGRSSAAVAEFLAATLAMQPSEWRMPWSSIRNISSSSCTTDSTCSVTMDAGGPWMEAYAWNVADSVQQQ
jgi:hypothetical protein